MIVLLIVPDRAQMQNTPLEVDVREIRERFSMFKKDREVLKISSSPLSDGSEQVQIECRVLDKGAMRITVTYLPAAKQQDQPASKKPHRKRSRSRLGGKLAQPSAREAASGQHSNANTPILERVVVKDATMHVLEILAGILRYKQCIIKGLQVKDEMGNKTTTDVCIYVSHNVNLEIPSFLYLSTEMEDFGDGDERAQVYSPSPILMSLLESGSLLFKTDTLQYRLARDRHGFTLCGKHINAKDRIAGLLDGYNIHSQLKMILNQPKWKFAKSLKGMLMSGKGVSFKAFQSQLPADLDQGQLEYLKKVVQNSMKFYDCRDNFVHRLSRMVEERLPLIRGPKYEQLQMHIYPMAARRPEHTVKYLCGGKYQGIVHSDVSAVKKIEK